MGLVVMDKKSSLPYLITVDKSVRQALDLLTRKREFALLAANQRLSPAEEEALQHADCLWIEIRGVANSAMASRAEYYYLVISTGDHTSSRDALPAAGLLPNSEFGACLRELECDGRIEVLLLPIGSLYEFCEGATLVVDIASEDLPEDEANGFWLRGMLQLGMDPGKWYASDDFSSIKVSLKRVSAKPESEIAEKSEPCDGVASVDIAEFEVYDRLRGKFENLAQDRDCGYGDDIFVEYSISSDEGDARYCAIEFYSNHNWDCDPANLLVVRFCAEIIPGECGSKDVQFSHPSKTTERKGSDERFLVDSLAMVNDVEVKFSSGHGENKRPDETVSADRVIDNPIDFFKWIDVHRKEIELL